MYLKIIFVSTCQWFFSSILFVCAVISAALAFFRNRADSHKSEALGAPVRNVVPCACRHDFAPARTAREGYNAAAVVEEQPLGTFLSCASTPTAMTRIPYRSEGTNGWFGDRYLTTKSLDIVDIAKLVRKDIKEQLPEIKTRVRVERLSADNVLEVIITKTPFDPFTPPTAHGNIFDSTGYATNVPISPEAATAIALIQDITDSYNRDLSEPMFDLYDVRFYSRVGVEQR
jgi:hypothetical protein